MSNRKGLVAIAFGAALSLVVGSVLALTSDSVRIEGNEVLSGTYTVPAHDLKVAWGDCNTATYSDGPFTAVFSSGGGMQDVYLDGPIESGFFCLKNAGSETGRVSVAFSNVFSSEVGSCQESETVAGDQTCSPGEKGELTEVLNVSTVVADVAGNSCMSKTLNGVFGSSAIIVVDYLAPGAWCNSSLAVEVDGSATDAARLLAQTDRVQWDIVFTLEDIPA